MNEFAKKLLVGIDFGRFATMVRAAFVAAILIFAATVPIAAGPIDDAWAVYESGEFETGVRLMRPFAEQGDPRAQGKLGMMYDLGFGVRQDYAEALKWYRMAAEQGDAEAQNILGLMYQKGRNVPQDYAKALKLYRQAAEQGHTSAQSALGSMYNEGRGVPQNYAEAAMWYRMAAEQGAASAQGVLGIMYAEGRGVRQDNVLAHMWINLAASSGMFERAHEARDLVEQRMSREQIAEAQRLAREWKPK